MTRASSPVRIRRARAGDVAELVRIEHAAFATDRLSRRSLLALTRSPTAAMLIAEADGVVAGYATVLRRRTARVARLYSLAVDPARRGRGIGEALLQAAERTACESGADRLRLEVRRDNSVAEHLYRRAGYVQVGSLPSYYEDGADGLRMEKPLVDRAA